MHTTGEDRLPKEKYHVFCMYPAVSKIFVDMDTTFVSNSEKSMVWGLGRFSRGIGIEGGGLRMDFDHCTKKRGTCKTLVQRSRAALS
jgi:hypothetical protein